MTPAPICTIRGCDNEVPDGGLQCVECRSGRYPETRGNIPGNNSGNIPGNIPALPVKLTVPWSALASDNLRKGVAGDVNRAKQQEYRAALAKLKKSIAEQYDGPQLAGPLQVVAVFYMPNNLARDHHNFSKILMDAIRGLVCVEDRWQVTRRTIFDVAGIDVDRPRCEIIIREWEEICWLQ